MHRRTFATLALAFATAAFPAALFAQVPQSLTITLQQTTPNPVLVLPSPNGSVSPGMASPGASRMVGAR